ncbi:MAG: hypothetical protein ABI970_02330 [Chloroflexota bacterium]
MLSRRSFLQLVGASLAATALRPTSSLLAAAPSEVYQGRALTALPVFATRNESAAPIAHLWPDSMTTILYRDDDWYQIPSGWVRRDDLQPMLPYDSRAYQFVQDAPFWAEVVAPVASVRTYCAADAPLVTRIGHGGVSRVIDTLPGEPNGWYAIADQNGGLLGWTQGMFWRLVEMEIKQGNSHSLYVDRKRGLMTAYDGVNPILEAPFSEGVGLQAGDFTSRRGVIGGMRWQDGKIYEGVSWQTVFGNGQTIAGVYWHNRFGHAVSGGPAVQITPLLAHWLYGWLGDNIHIVVE